MDDKDPPETPSISTVQEQEGSLDLIRAMRMFEEESDKRLQALKRKSRSKGYLADLNRRAESFEKLNSFLVGELVQWKSGLSNRPRPAYKAPARVMAVLESPRQDEEGNANAPDFAEPLDLVIGLIDEDDEFVLFHVDSRRFEQFG